MNSGKPIIGSLIVFLFSLNTFSNGVTYYVSPTGNDNTNTGTFESPWFTLAKVWSHVTAGDTVYMRGGTYNYATTMNIGFKNGTDGNPITLMNYPGEMPVIDGGSNTSSSIFNIRNSAYLHIKGIRCTNLVQPHNPSTGYYGIILWTSVTHCTFELMETDHIGGWGVVIGDKCSDVLFLNCDSHHNQDSLSTDAFGGSDGFETGSHGIDASTNITFRGCRAWSNSDDGWDIRQADGVYTIDNCWSFWNGFIPGTWADGGNGDGFKLGGKTTPPTDSILRTITNSLSFRNRGTGITPEPDDLNSILGTAIYNCTAYDNSSGWGNGINTGGYENYTIVKNCIDYNNHGNGEWMQSGSVHDHNNFDLSLDVSDADFVSVSSDGMDGARRADGSLPVLDFLKLAPGSSLIDAGTDIGMPFAGLSPDLGAFESGLSTGTSNQIKNDLFQAYPNPVKDNLLIRSGNSSSNLTINLLDSKGVSLTEKTFSGNYTLDFSSRSPGIYYLRVAGDGKTTINKIVKY